MTDDDIKVAWLREEQASDYNDYAQGFKSGYAFARQEAFNEQEAVRERENANRRRFRQLKKETER